MWSMLNVAGLIGVLGQPHLTVPVRRCGLTASFKYLDVACLEALGFTNQCAMAWYYNSLHTAQNCFWPCIEAWIKNTPFVVDGKLNKCLECDETKSGPIFKLTAGRTRRDSGILSAIPRPDEQVFPMQHLYWRPPPYVPSEELC